MKFDKLLLTMLDRGVDEKLNDASDIPKYTGLEYDTSIAGGPVSPSSNIPSLKRVGITCFLTHGTP